MNDNYPNKLRYNPEPKYVRGMVSAVQAQTNQTLEQVADVLGITRRHLQAHMTDENSNSYRPITYERQFMLERWVADLIEEMMAEDEVEISDPE